MKFVRSSTFGELNPKTEVLNHIKKHLRGTKLIFVFGLSGTGKTTLLKELTGLDLKPGHMLDSGTKEYHVFPAVVHGEKYIFVDTPGFGAADIPDMDIMDHILSCIDVLGSYVTIAGALYLYDCHADRLTTEQAKTLRWLQCFCGPNFYQNITVVSTKWDSLSPKEQDKAMTRFESLKTNSDSGFGQILQPPAPFTGGQVYYHGVELDDHWDNRRCLDPDDDVPERKRLAQRMIQRRYGDASVTDLQILVEKQKNKEKQQTQAVRALEAEIDSSKIRIKGESAIILDINAQDPIPGPSSNDSPGEPDSDSSEASVSDPEQIAWEGPLNGMAYFWFRMTLTLARFFVGAATNMTRRRK
ncbi:P-loop containing nucleoside triphosphate hydrolase protein [Hypoxylon sp. FL1284]|nr:P-loop containing nucleoside triphosphate hydrolase protein [Hypoxylon sp. FL1284]